MLDASESMKAITRAVWLPVLGCLLFSAGCRSIDEVNSSEFAALEDLSPGRQLSYTTTQFTRPYIDVSADGSELFFDLMGEIYRMPTKGGAAIRIELGPGWKTRPMLSPGGETIAFLSDRGKGVGAWGKRLESLADVDLYAEADAAEIVSMAWLNDRQLAMVQIGVPEPVPYTVLVADTSENRQRIALKPAIRDGRSVETLIGRSKAIHGIYWFDRELVFGNILTGARHPISTNASKRLGQFRLTADGNHLGYAQHRSGKTFLSMLDLASGESRSTACELEPSLMMNTQIAADPTYAFLPDGRSIVLSRSGTFHRCYLSGGEVPIEASAAIDIRLAPKAISRHARVQRVQVKYPTINMGLSQVLFTVRGKLWKKKIGDAKIEMLSQQDGEEYMPDFSPDEKHVSYVSIADGASALRVRDIQTGTERDLLRSTQHAFANPTWSSDGSQIAYIEADLRATTLSAQIKRIDLSTQKIDIFGEIEVAIGANRSYPMMSWTPDDKGIYYTRQVSSYNRELVYHPIIGAPVAVMTFDPDIKDVLVSKSGRYLAFQDTFGIAVAPMFISVAEKRHMTSSEVRQMRRISTVGADYVAWTKHDQLLWSRQDEVFLTGTDFESNQIVEVPPHTKVNAFDSIRVYSGARIITMAEDGVIEAGAIVTDGARLRYVGPETNMPAHFNDYERIDLTGMTVIPGLIDTHFHMSRENDDFVSAPDYDLFANAAYGVTTIFDPSISTIKTAFLSDITQQDDFPGASFYGSGYPLLGGYVGGSLVKLHGIDDARQIAKRLADAGAPMLKAYWRPSRADRRIIVEAAREMGIGVTSHEKNDIRTHLGTVQDGYSAIEHDLLDSAAPFYDDVIVYLKESRISITPTSIVDFTGTLPAFLMAHTNHDMRFECLIQHVSDGRHDDGRVFGADVQVSDIQMEHLTENARMLSRGVEIGIGSHGFPAGLGSHWEMHALALGGARPMDILRAGTVNGARKLNLAHRIGSLVAGMDADFVVLRLNPLDDIRNSTDIVRVVRRGLTLEWPDGARWPLSWNAQGDWSKCANWNLGNL